MFCEKCGAVLDDNSIFCENCGSKCEQEQTAALPSAAAATSSRLDTHTQPAVASPKPIKLGIKGKIVITVCLILAVICGIGYGVMSNLAKPEKVVDKIVASIQKGDYETLYDYLDVPQGEFLTKEMFVSANSKQYQEILDSYGFDSSNYRNPSKLKELRNIKTYSIKPNKYSNSLLSSDYEIEYTLAGSSNVYTMDISLVKSGKKFLFFDDYRMGSEGFIGSDVEFKFPSLLTVALNNVTLTPSSNETYYGTECSVYKIPYLFAGAYDVKLTSDFTKEVNCIMLTDDSGNNQFFHSNSTTNGYEPSDALVQTINQKTTAFFDAFFKGIESNSEFSAIESYTSPDSDMESTYWRYNNSHHRPYRILDKLSYSDLEITEGEFGVNKYQINVSLNVHQVTYDHPDNVYEPSDEPYTDDTEATFEIVFVYENGDWLIESMNSRYF